MVDHNLCPSGGIGRRRGLKPPGSQDLTGSSPVSGTTNKKTQHEKEHKMSDFTNPPDPSLSFPPSNNNKNITPKQLGAAVFFIAALILLLIVIVAPGDNSSTPITTDAPAPVVTNPPAPPVNKYDAYLEHVYNNSGQANTLSKAKLIEYGDTICQSLDSGRSIAWITSYLSSYSNGQSDVELYASIIYGAITYICDEYKGDLNLYLNN